MSEEARKEILHLIQEDWQVAREIFKEHNPNDEELKAYRAGYFQALLNLKSSM